MEFSITTIWFAVGAGFMSVINPCVFPLLPIVVAGPNKEDKLRPILLIIGLSITFILMGVLATLFGSFFVGKTRIIEIIGAVIVLIFGVLTLFNINIFKKVTFFNKFSRSGHSGRFSGLIIGLTLGLIWIPCIGPMLSSILLTVGTTGSLLKGVVLLFFYSVGFAIPLLIVAYASFLFKKMSFLKSKPMIVNIVSGILMISFGIYLLIWGMI